jgi:hypothetical protein
MAWRRTDAAPEAVESKRLAVNIIGTGKRVRIYIGEQDKPVGTTNNYGKPS